ncbi:hypothetical protein M885DRAFT_532230 [Pelagophyceae sp. CCMP2097]|nr:hypothetical protein M885DRAFT_532230 [Pelagophyceae sp. CCMP2097]
MGARSLHFVTGDFEARRVFLADVEYGLALDCLVKGCADVLVTRQAPLRILLGRRCVEPQPDWWFVGGRARPGEAPQQAAMRNVKRELGLDFDARRFRVVGSYSLVWHMRVQVPKTNGTADISIVHSLDLDDAAAGAISFETHFAKSEYCDAAWFAPLDILQGDFHPALQQAVRDLLARSALDDVRAAAQNGANDAAIAAAARRLAAWHDSNPTDDAIKVHFDGQSYHFADAATGASVPRPRKPIPHSAFCDFEPPTFWARAAARLDTLLDGASKPLAASAFVLLGLRCMRAGKA